MRVQHAAARRHMVKHKSPPWIALIVLMTVVAVVIRAFSQILGRSRWQLSATNTPGGLEVEVFQEGDNSPTYSTMLSNHRIKRNIERKTIDTRMLAPLIAKGSRKRENTKGLWRTLAHHAC